MMPVPKHLRECAVPHDTTIDESNLVASIRCPCGSDNFNMLYPSQTHKYYDKDMPCTTEIDGDFFFLIKAKCCSCGREHLLFDQDFHGYNGFVCHDKAQASKPRPPLTAWKCMKCGDLKHAATIQVNTQGKQDFIEEGGEDFNPEEWFEGFDWFTVSLKCTSCGKATTEWVSLETM